MWKVCKFYAYNTSTNQKVIFSDLGGWTDLKNSSWKVYKFYAHNKETDKWVTFANIEGWIDLV